MPFFIEFIAPPSNTVEELVVNSNDCAACIEVMVNDVPDMPDTIPIICWIPPEE
jgi:hypothetical protein